MSELRAEEARKIAENTRKEFLGEREEFKREVEESARKSAEGKFKPALEDIFKRIKEESSNSKNAEYFHHDYEVSLGVEVVEDKESRELRVRYLPDKFLAYKLISHLEGLGYKIELRTRETTLGSGEYSPEVIIKSWIIRWHSY